MNRLIEDLLINIRDHFNYPVFWYDTVSKVFGRIESSGIEKRNIPNIIAPALEDHTLFMKSFVKDGRDVVFYFFRQFLDDRKIIIILQDFPDGSQLNHFISILLRVSSDIHHDNSQCTRELDFMREELNECESEVIQHDERVMLLEDELDDKSHDLDRLEELVGVLKKSRSKLIKLVDGLDSPLFSVDRDFEVSNINRAIGDYLGIDDLPSFIGSKCFKVIFNEEERCPWCKVDEVIETKDSITQHIEVDLGGQSYTFSQTMFPILDAEGHVVEIGEYLDDITAQYKLINSLEKSKEKLRKVSKDKIDKISEISVLKIEYGKLYENYEASRLNVGKLTKALEKLLEQNTVIELLQLKTEVKEFKFKLFQNEETIKNYKVKLEEKHVLVHDLNKKAVYSMDRLFNILNNKKEITNDDHKMVMDFLNGQIKMLKSNLEEQNVSESSN